MVGLVECGVVRGHGSGEIAAEGGVENADLRFETAAAEGPEALETSFSGNTRTNGVCFDEDGQAIEPTSLESARQDYLRQVAEAHSRISAGGLY